MPTLAILLVGLAGACLMIDVPLARLFRTQPFPTEVRRMLERAEVFGHAYGVIGIAVTIAVLSPRLVSRIPRLLA